MKLPSDAEISLEKLTHYLLVPLARADKSAFLSRAGYTLNNPGQLSEDLRSQILALDATRAESNEFGDYYTICGELRGPNGTALRVKTVWIRDPLREKVRFITLLPDKSKTP